MNIAALKCKTLVRQFHHIVDAIGNEAGISYVVNAKLKEENPLLLQRQSHFPSENKEENPLLANGLAFSFGKQGGLEREKICT